MKKFLGEMMQCYWRWRFSRRAVLLGRAHFGRHTRVVCSNGSRREDIVIEDGAKVYGTLISQNGGEIRVCTGAHIGPFTTIGAAKSVYIGPLAMISSHVDIMDNNNHPVHPDDRKKMNEDGLHSPFKKWSYSSASPVTIGANTWIGKRSIILKGVNVGDNAIVATGAVVTKNISPGSVAAGNPAVIVKENIEHERRLL